MISIAMRLSDHTAFKESYSLHVSLHNLHELLKGTKFFLERYFCSNWSYLFAIFIQDIFLAYRARTFNMDERQILWSLDIQFVY